MAACARGRHRDRLEVPAAHRGQACLQSRRLCDRGRCCLLTPASGYRRGNGARAYGSRRSLGFLAILVLQKARRADIAIYFLLSHAAFLGARALWLGDPIAIPLHQMQSGSLLIFAFFMISDPRTSPDSRLGRFLFAFAVAALAHYLAFFVQMRPALYFALIALSPATLLIDRVLPAPRFAWRTPALKGASA